MALKSVKAKDNTRTMAKDILGCARDILIRNVDSKATPLYMFWLPLFCWYIDGNFYRFVDPSSWNSGYIQVLDTSSRTTSILPGEIFDDIIRIGVRVQYCLTRRRSADCKSSDTSCTPRFESWYSILDYKTWSTYVKISEVDLTFNNWWVLAASWVGITLLGTS